MTIIELQGQRIEFPNEEAALGFLNSLDSPSPPSDGLSLSTRKEINPVESDVPSPVKARWAEQSGTKAPTDFIPDFSQTEIGGNTKLSQRKTKHYDLIKSKAEQYGLPVDLFVRQIGQESGYNEKAKSPVGAMGLGQLMPGTAKELGVTDPWNPEQNIDGAARYLKKMYDRYGKWDLALAAYNAGPGNVDKYSGIPPFKETQNYVKRILGDKGLAELKDFSPMAQVDDLKAIGRGALSTAKPAAQLLDAYMDLPTQGMSWLGETLNSDTLTNVALQTVAAKEWLMGEGGLAGDIETLQRQLITDPQDQTVARQLRSAIVEGATGVLGYGAQIKAVSFATQIKNVPFVVGTLEYGKGRLDGLTPMESFQQAAFQSGLFLGGGMINKFPLGKFEKAGLSGALFGGMTMATGGTASDSLAHAMLGAAFGFNEHKGIGGAQFQKALQARLHGALRDTRPKLSMKMEVENANKIQTKTDKFRLAWQDTYAKTEATIASLKALKDFYLTHARAAQKGKGLNIGKEPKEKNILGKELAGLKDLLPKEVRSALDTYLANSSLKTKEFKLSEVNRIISSMKEAGEKKFVDTLRERGFLLDEYAKASKDSSRILTGTNWLNQVERWSVPTKKIGLDSGGMAYQMIDAKIRVPGEIARLQFDTNLPQVREQAKNLDPHLITEWLHYARTDKNGLVFWEETPLRIKGKVDTPPYPADLRRPTAAEQAVVFQLRAALDYAQTQGPAGYLPGYVPLRRMINPKDTSRLPAEAVLESMQHATYMNARKSGKWDPLYEKNIWKLLDKYFAEVARTRMFHKLAPKAQQIYDQFRMMGLESDAQAWSRFTAEALGFPDPIYAKNTYFNRIINRNPNRVGEVVEMITNREPALADQIWSMVKTMTYKSYMSYNLKTHLGQAFQPEAMGWAELSPRYVARGRQEFFNAAKNKNSEARQLLDLPDVKGRLLGVTLDRLAGDIYAPITNKTLKQVEKWLSFPVEPGNKAFMAWEKVNRPAAFLGGYYQFKEAPNKTKLISETPLSAGERQVLLDVLRTGNEHAAAIEYGIIKNNRINFIFDFINRPQVFKEGFGREIPFVSYPSNVWSKYLASDTLSGKAVGAEMIAKRLVLPALLFGLIGRATDSDLKGLHPIHGIHGMIDGTPSPALSNTAKAFFSDYKLKSMVLNGLNWIGWVNVAQRIDKAQRKGAREGLGLKRRKKNE